MTYTDGLLQRLRALTRCEHSDLSIGDEAADEIERLRAEVANLKIDAAMDGSIAADNRDQRTHFTAQWRAEKDRATRAESELAALREEIARYATSLTVALGHRDEFKRRAEAAESELASLRGRIDGGKATSTIVDRARELAYRAHAGQVDKAGRPYIEHVARVAAAVSDDPAAEAVGWVHDVMEDQPQYATLMMERLPASLYCAANLLDRNVAGGPLGYYERIRENPIALRIKLADIADNADESRLALLDEKTASRLRAKYADARRRLGVDEG